MRSFPCVVSLLAFLACIASCAEGLPSDPAESADLPEGGVRDGSAPPPPMEGGSEPEDSGGGPAPMADAAIDAAVDPCADGQKNGTESDTDCGGSKCDPCGAGDSCVVATDCDSNMCDATMTCAMGMPDGGSMAGDPCATLMAPEPACMCKGNAGKAYFFCPGPKDWNAARTACMGVMADLVAIEDMAEQTFLEPNVTANSWIGAANVGTTSWVWTATGTEFWNMMAIGGAFAKWQAGHPIAVAGWCAMIQQTAKTWVTMACTLPSGYICEK